MFAFFQNHTDEIIALALFFSFSFPLLTLGVHALCRELLELRLAASHSKRAMKEARRGFIAGRHFSGWLLDWQRSITAEDDAPANRLLTLNEVCVRLFPFGEALCIAGYWYAVCAWLGAAISTVYLVLLLVLYVRYKRAEKKAPAQKSSPYEKKVPMAHLLHSGYATAALLFLYARLWIPAGVLLTVNAVHLLILRAKKADLFYCTVQLMQHRATTPHHHTDGFRRFAEREGRNFAIFELAVGVPCMLLPIILHIFHIT